MHINYFMHRQSKLLLLIICIIFLEMYRYYSIYANKIKKTNLDLKQDSLSYFSTSLILIKLIKPFCNCLKMEKEIIVIEKLDLKSLNHNSSTKDIYVFVSLIQFSKKKKYNGKKKTLFFKEKLENLKRDKITCDLYNVLKRGKNQRVISYSLYGKNKIYYERLEIILEQMRAKYTNFTVRVYYDKTVNKTLRCYFECKYKDVDFCNVNYFSNSLSGQLGFDNFRYDDLNYMHKMMWRFMPVGDSYVDLFMSRDTDSFIIDREIDSVREWLLSGKVGHIMRGKNVFYKLN